MESRRILTTTEVNKTALDYFIYQPVSREMIAYLVAAAHNVIACDSPSSYDQTLPPSPPTTPEEDSSLPTVEEFITKLVVSSNVQVPTLMSTLVYLGRLKSKLQPMARGLPCTTHRIFLASLILCAKYLNDSSPKNKHWASYTNIVTDWYSFGFSRTEVNLMEKQLLFLLDWGLRITDEDLQHYLDPFLAPLREQVVERHTRKMRLREEKRRQKEMQAAAIRYPSPASSSRGHSRTRLPSPEDIRSRSSASVSPPGLSYSSSSSSYASSISSAGNHHSRSATPLDQQPATYFVQDGLCESPVEIMMEAEPKVRIVDINPRMLPYEISERDYEAMQSAQEHGKKRARKGMWERITGAVAVR